MKREEKNKIWLVDDNETFLNIMTTVLLAMLPRSYTLAAVDSAKDVDAKPGDIVVLDQHGCDSDFLSGRKEGIEIIAISGDRDLEGVVDLYKPFTPDDLIEQIYQKMDLIEKSRAA